MEGANSSPFGQPTNVGSALAPQAGTEPNLGQQTIARRAKVCCRSGRKIQQRRAAIGQQLKRMSMQIWNSSNWRRSMGQIWGSSSRGCGPDMEQQLKRFRARSGAKEAKRRQPGGRGEADN